MRTSLSGSASWVGLELDALLSCEARGCRRKEQLPKPVWAALMLAQVLVRPTRAYPATSPLPHGSPSLD